MPGFISPVVYVDTKDALVTHLGSGGSSQGAPGLGWVAPAPFPCLGQAQDFAIIKIVLEIPSWPRFLFAPGEGDPGGN